LQARKPGEVSDAECRQAIDDAGLFLDKWGKVAADNGWTTAIYSTPRAARSACPITLTSPAANRASLPSVD